MAGRKESIMHIQVAISFILVIILIGCSTQVEEKSIDEDPQYPFENSPEYGQVTDHLGLGNALRESEHKLPEVQGMKDDQGLIFGPYIVDSHKYWVKNDKVLPENTSKKDKVEILHNYHMTIRRKPIFYGALDFAQQANFSRFRDFGDEQYLARTCNITMPYPADYLDNLSKSIEMTDIFLERLSYENALKLHEQNKLTLDAYKQGLHEYVRSFTEPEIENSSCYTQIRKKAYEPAFKIPFTYKVINNNNIKSFFSQMNDNAGKLERKLNMRSMILDGDHEAVPSDIEERKPDTKLPVTYPDRNLTNKIFSMKQISDNIMKHLRNTTVNQSNQSRDIVDEMDVSSMELPDIEEDDLYLFEIDLHCFNMEEAYIYGVNEDYYPKVFIATHMNPCLDDLLSTCNCPYSHETILRWHNLFDMFQKVGNLPLAPLLKEEQIVKDAEEDFIDYPSQDNLMYLATAYETAYDNLLSEEEFNPAMEELWRRRIQIESPIYMYAKTFESFHDELDQRYEYFWKPSYKEDRSLSSASYRRDFMTESLFYLHLMPWSSSVYLSDHPDRLTSVDHEQENEELIYWEDFFTSTEHISCYTDQARLYERLQHPRS